MLFPSIPQNYFQIYSTRSNIHISFKNNPICTEDAPRSLVMQTVRTDRQINGLRDRNIQIKNNLTLTVRTRSSADSVLRYGVQQSSVWYGSSAVSLNYLMVHLCSWPSLHEVEQARASAQGSVLTCSPRLRRVTENPTSVLFLPSLCCEALLHFFVTYSPPHWRWVTCTKSREMRCLSMQLTRVKFLKKKNLNFSRFVLC